MKDRYKDLLRSIENELSEDSYSLSELGDAEEFDSSGLRKWELEFLRRGRIS